jgi:phage FluMu protein Com
LNGTGSIRISKGTLLCRIGLQHHKRIRAPRCHVIAFVTIAFISILARRLKRLVAEELSA